MVTNTGNVTLTGHRDGHPDRPGRPWPPARLYQASPLGPARARRTTLAPSQRPPSPPPTPSPRPTSTTARHRHGHRHRHPAAGRGGHLDALDGHRHGHPDPRTLTRGQDRHHDRSTRTLGQAITYTFVVTNTGNVTADRRQRDRQPDRHRPDSAGPTTCPDATGLCRRRRHLHGHLHRHPGRHRRRLDHQLGHRHGHPAHRPAVTSTSVRRWSSRPPRPRHHHRQDRHLHGPLQRGGQTITYQFVATNTGNVTLTGVGVNDTQTAPAGALATGRPASRWLAHRDLLGLDHHAWPRTSRPPSPPPTPLTQADLDNGSVNDSATASGTPPTGLDSHLDASTATVTDGPDPRPDRDQDRRPRPATRRRRPGRSPTPSRPPTPATSP